MPFGRIGLSKDAPAGRVRIVGQASCGATIEMANVPVSGKAGIEGPGTLVNPIADEV